MDKIEQYKFLDRIFLRAPFYSPEDYILERMPEVPKRVSFRNALWLASPDFYRVLEKQNFDWELLGKKERFSLCKYYNRMSFRATPFGAFSSFSLLAWNEADQVRLVEANRSVLHLLPSREWQRYAEDNAKNRQEDYHVRTNPTMMLLGNSFSFVSSESDATGKIKFLVNSISAERLNRKIAALAAKAPVLKSTVISRITCLTGCSHPAAAEYFEFLVAEQVYLTEYDGCLIAPGTRVSKENHITMEDNAFDDRNSKLLNNIPFTNHLGLERETGKLGSLLNEVADSFEGNKLYGGLERAVQDGGLGTHWQEELKKVIRLLQKIVIPFPTPALIEFVTAFKVRFDGQKIPLLQALDPDAGIGYGNLHSSTEESSLLKNVSFPRIASDKSLVWTAVHRLFFRLWRQNFIRLPFDPLVISEADLTELESVNYPVALPPSLALLFSRTEGKLVLENNGGATATALIGRFTAFSPEVEALCREIVRVESACNPDVIFAELHQLSDAHVDNINRRRPVYDHIIHINSYPGDTGQQVIALDDLQLSVRGDDLILESISLGRRVIPRLPTAYNFQHNRLALFQLLCDLQYQGLQANLTFNLEHLFPGLPFYPRVFYGDTIISLAKWRLDGHDICSLTSAGLSISRLHLFRQERGLPRTVTMGLSDQQLVFDLGNDSQALFFLENLKEFKTIMIREYLEPDRSVTAGKKKLAAQFVALLKNNGKIYSGIGPGAFNTRQLIQRRFLPGSDWLYLKIYCTPGAADKILLWVIRPFLKVHKQQIRSWFFIRYQDPDPHIRLRILAGSEDYGRIIVALRDRLSSRPFAVLVRDVKQDTYQREVERYSVALIEKAEDCFGAGSSLALNWRYAQQRGDTDIQMKVFSVTCQMIKLFIAQPLGQLIFLEWRSERFIAEFGGTKEFRVHLDQKYRALAKELEFALAENKPGAPAYHGRSDLSRFLQTVLLMAEGSAGWENSKRQVLLADLIHMQINRFFPDRQRQHEALIFYCLHKYAASLNARAKKV